MKIEQYNPYFIRIDPTPRHSTLLSDSDLRELVTYIKEKKPEIIRDVICDECPEVC